MRMSQVVREMIDYNIAKKVRFKGGRKEYIRVENNYHQTFISLFTSNWKKAVNKSRNFEYYMDKKIHNTNNSSLTLVEKQEIINEIKLWKNYYDWIERLINFFESGQIFEHVPIEEKTNEKA